MHACPSKMRGERIQIYEKLYNPCEEKNIK